MPRAPRVDVGGQVYHVLNRANARARIFDDAGDYKIFEQLLTDGVEAYDIQLLAYCLMPNHFHLVLSPKVDGVLSQFMGWLSNAHTRKWHVAKGTIGQGHLYQGRYKSFLCQQDKHLLILIRYVERNALSANLVRRAEDWRWSSVWRREKGTEQQKKVLSPWPIPMPRNYVTLVNQPQPADEEEALDRAQSKGFPFGTDHWVMQTVERFGLEQTMRPVGRPRKGG